MSILNMSNYKLQTNPTSVATPKIVGPPAVNVERSQDGKVHTITLNRPSTKNAVDRITAEMLHTAFLDFEADAKACCAVLHGEGGVFCAGADLKALFEGYEADDAFGSEGNSFDEPILHDKLQAAPMGPTRLALSKPVIAAIEGPCVAGGLELACWCDLRVADETAMFGVLGRRWGVPLVDGGSVRLPRLVGQSRALDMVLTGRPVKAEEALQIGLANRVVPRGTALEAAQALAAQIAASPAQNAIRKERQSVIEQWNLPSVQHALRNEYRLARSAVGGATSLDQGETIVVPGVMSRL